MRRALIVFLFVLMPLNAAMAHTGVGPTSGLVNGFLHPLSGFDHILAITLVGLLAVRIGGKAFWGLPLTFIAMMVVGGVLGMTHVALPLVKVGIAFSIVALGLSLALAWKPPVVIAVTMTGLFAVFHGHAHGSEMPVSASGFAYGTGFIAATALLQASGILLGLGLRTAKFGELALRLAGAASALVGTILLLGST